MKTAPQALNAASASGSYLYLKDGRKLLDGISSWWLITHGHCHPSISETIAKQSRRLDQVVFANFMHDAAAELVEELKLVLPSALNTVFFSDNGSTAVEVAMKMAYQYCQQTGQTSKKIFCAFRESYHGDTIGAMSVTGEGTFTNPYSQLRIKVIRCDQGTQSTDPIEMWVNGLEQTLQLRGREIAAVILEPLIQGAGGMIVWPIEAVRKIIALCKAYKVLLVFDEVMTGFGRTGRLFAFENFLPARPDFVCLSKGLTGGSLPLALTLTSQEIYDAFLSDEVEKTFFHGHSFTANAISCAAAAESLRIFKREETLEKITRIEGTHRAGLYKMGQKFELNDTRICGSIGAIELKKPKSGEDGYGNLRGREIFKYCIDRELFIRPLGEILYLMPPYCTEPQEIEQAWEIIGKCLEAFQ